MATYGEFPGVRVETAGGGIAGVNIGAEEKLVIFAEYDSDNGSASLDEPEQVSSRSTVKDYYGERDNSPLTDAIFSAWGNGANRDYTYGVPVETETDADNLSLSDAFDNTVQTVREGETGVFAVISDTEDDATALSEQVDTLRNDYKMVKGVLGAEPNDGDTEFDTGSYENPLTSDSMFLHAPTRRSSETDELVTGAVSGLFAGNDITEPVYKQSLRGVEGLNQVLTKSEADDLRDEEVIPLRQNGGVEVADNTSTSDEDDWERDFWRRRIVDRVVLIAFEVGDTILGRINNDDTRDAAEDLIDEQFQQLADDDLIKPNTDETENHFVEVTENPSDTDQVDIDLGVTPNGVVKRVDTTVTIDT